MRLRARVDGPHAEIMKGLRQVGCAVRDTSRLGGGFPDLTVRVPMSMRPHSRVVLVEVKRPGGKLTPAQIRFCDDFPETLIVESLDEALGELGFKAV